VFAQLIPAAGGDPITIDKDITVVGRQAEHCEIVLSRKSVSKIHCVIAKTDGLLFVRDLDSTNGTKVNGQRIIRGALLPGDQLAFAGEKFKVHLGPDSNGAGEPRPVSPISHTENLEDVPSLGSLGANAFDDGAGSALPHQLFGPANADDLVE
jgi:pSer/pThr/pTyr-binding forkhead associated (FHA) protein